jgi:iron complex transport system substrate-binding protein
MNMRNMRYKIVICFIIAAITLTLTGCGAFDFFGNLFGRGNDDDSPTQPNLPDYTQAEPEPYPITIDGVEIEQSPAEIISLSPALTEILFEFDEGSRIIARSDYCDYPLETAEISAVFSAILDLDVR